MPDQRSTFFSVEPTDRQLVDSLRAGDEAAFRAGRERANGSMLRVAQNPSVPSQAIAEDVVVDVAAGAQRTRPLPGPLPAEDTWSFGSSSTPPRRAHSARAGSCRSRRYRIRPSAPGSSSIRTGSGPEDDERYPGHWSSPPRELPEERLLAAETRTRIAAVIDALPANQAAVIRLRVCPTGWSSEEVCNALDISEVNQRSLLSPWARARACARRSRTTSEWRPNERCRSTQLPGARRAGDRLPGRGVGSRRSPAVRDAHRGLLAPALPTLELQQMRDTIRVTLMLMPEDLSPDADRGSLAGTSPTGRVPNTGTFRRPARSAEEDAAGSLLALTPRCSSGRRQAATSRSLNRGLGQPGGRNACGHHLAEPGVRNTRGPGSLIRPKLIASVLDTGRCSHRERDRAFERSLLAAHREDLHRAALTRFAPPVVVEPDESQSACHGWLTRISS